MKVAPSSLFGTRHIIDLGRRESIAGLRYGIPGMRVGGKREIVISPHLAYGERGVPGLILVNALLRCEVDLLEIRQYNAVLPEDYLPGKSSGSIEMILTNKASHGDSPCMREGMHGSPFGKFDMTSNSRSSRTGSRSQFQWI